MPLDKRSFADSLGIKPPDEKPPTDIPPVELDEEEEVKGIAQKVRPGEIANMIGQWELRTQVLTKVRASVMHNELPNHFLFYGAPGLGKTTLAKIVAFEMNAKLKVVEASAVNTTTKMANMLGELDKGTVVLIDEIHGLPRVVQEMLGLAMEDFSITVSVGTNRNQVTTQPRRIKPFVLVGATTLAGNLTGPLRDRFGFVGNLSFYEDEEIATILERASQLLHNKIEPDAAAELASRSRGVPRVALNLLSKVADYATVSTGEPNAVITPEIVNNGLELFDIDIYGMTEADRKALRSLCVDHMGGPVGIKKWASGAYVDMRTMETVIEPFLIRAGFIRATTRGRVANPQAFHIFNLKVPPFLQQQIDLANRD